MPSQQLLDQYQQLLGQSKSFGVLSKEKQEELRSSFNNGTDDQLNTAIETLKADITETARREAEFAAEEARLMEEALKKKAEQKKAREAEMENNRKMDLEESTKAAEALISKLQKVAEKAPQKERKKLFGIF